MWRALLLALALPACNFTSSDNEMSKVIYYRDKQTDLCFAAYDLRRNWGFFIHVPCTDGVVKVARDMPKGTE